MLVTDGGQLIRCPVDGIRIAGRSTQGVIVFNTAEDEHVVSVERLTRRGRGERRVASWSGGLAACKAARSYSSGAMDAHRPLGGNGGLRALGAEGA